jgi:lysophospholipase L1-like esterase
VRGEQVVFIGDSFIAAPTSEIAPDLEMLWQAEGSSGYSATPRYHQLVGTTMQQIAGQYDTAHGQNADIKVVIGDGGGNDVLVTDRSCLTQAPPANTGCAATVEHAITVADAMLDKMEADGVEHFVYFFYPHERTSGVFQGDAPTINASLDYAEPRVRALCEKHSICTFVSLREAAGDALGSGYTDRGYINANDVHPSAAGSKFFAKAIWEAMKARCILSP